MSVSLVIIVIERYYRKVHNMKQVRKEVNVYAHEDEQQKP